MVGDGPGVGGGEEGVDFGINRVSEEGFVAGVFGEVEGGEGDAVLVGWGLGGAGWVEVGVDPNGRAGDHVGDIGGEGADGRDDLLVSEDGGCPCAGC